MIVQYALFVQVILSQKSGLLWEHICGKNMCKQEGELRHICACLRIIRNNYGKIRVCRLTMDIALGGFYIQLCASNTTVGKRATVKSSSDRTKVFMLVLMADQRLVAKFQR